MLVGVTTGLKEIVSDSLYSAFVVTGYCRRIHTARGEGG